MTKVLGDFTTSIANSPLTKAIEEIRAASKPLADFMTSIAPFGGSLFELQSEWQERFEQTNRALTAAGVASALFDSAKILSAIAGKDLKTRKDEWVSFAPEAQLDAILATQDVRLYAQDVVANDADASAAAKLALAHAWLVVVVAWLGTAYRKTRDSKDLALLIALIGAATGIFGVYASHRQLQQEDSVPILREIVAELRKKHQPTQAIAPTPSVSVRWISIRRRLSALRIYEPSAMPYVFARNRARSPARLVGCPKERS